MKPYIFPAWEKEAKTNDKARAIRKKAMDVANAYWVTQGKPNYGVNGNMALECLRTVPETQKDGPVGRFFYRFAPAYQRGTFVREWNNLYRKTLYARPSETAMAEASQKPEYQRKPGQELADMLQDVIIDIHNALANRGYKAWAIDGKGAIEWARYLMRNCESGPCDTYIRKAGPGWEDAIATAWDNWADLKQAEFEQMAHYPEIDKARRGREMAATLKPFFDWLEAIDYSLARVDEDGEARRVKLSLEGLTDLCWRYLGFDVTKLIGEMDGIMAKLMAEKEPSK